MAYLIFCHNSNSVKPHLRLAAWLMEGVATVAMSVTTEFLICSVYDCYVKPTAL
jgi:hypothetical protein